MKIFYLMIAGLCSTAPLFAQQVEKEEGPRAEKAAEAKQPSLTFYYFDG